MIIKIRSVTEYALIGFIFLIVYLVNQSNYTEPYNLTNSDVGYEYRQAMGIGEGVNPYEKILSGNILENNKYATLFPLYYYFLLIVGNISGSSFEDFIYMYRGILQIFEYFAFLFLYLRFRDSNKKVLGIFCAAFLLLNRWAILSTATLKQDMVAITFLLASLYLLDKKHRLALLLYGISLGIKHLGIFILPVYLLQVMGQSRRHKDYIYDAVIFAAPVVLPALPLIFDNVKAFYLSMIFSFTRKPASSCGISPTGYEKLLVNYKNLGNSIALFYLTLPRLPLAVFTLLNMFLLILRKINTGSYMLAAYLIFAALNPVYFDQYILWIIPFAMLVMINGVGPLTVEKKLKDP